MEELWKPIGGYEGLYEVSTCGNVRSVNRSVYCGDHFRCIKGKILKPHHDKYSILALSKKGKIKSCLVHRLVARTFLSNKENYKEVNHIDFNTKNNKVENLEWVTPLQNSRHTVNAGRRKNIIMPKKHDDMKMLTVFTFIVSGSSLNVAKRFDMSNSFINRISNGHKRKYLTTTLNAIKIARENNFAEYRQ